MTKPLYRITHWDEDHESSESRKLDSLNWVRLPRNLSSIGFRRISATKTRCELLSAWVLMVQVAADGKRGRRGVLVANGRALDAEDLALITGFPVGVFRQAIEFFADPQVGWLVDVSATAADAPAASSDAPAESPDVPAASPDASGKSADRGEERRGEKKRERRETARSKGAAHAGRPKAVEEVIAYFVDLQSNAAEARKFFDHFEANGWRQGGRSAMKDWHAAARNWVRRAAEFGGGPAGGKKSPYGGGPGAGEPFDENKPFAHTGGMPPASLMERPAGAPAPDEIVTPPAAGSDQGGAS